MNTRTIPFPHQMYHHGGYEDSTIKRGKEKTNKEEKMGK